MAANDDSAENRALHLAEQRGKDVERAENRFKSNENEIRYLKESNRELKQQVKQLASDLSALAGRFAAHLEVGEALTKQVEKSSDEQVSKKTYILGLVGAVLALGMLLIATLALLYGSR